MRGRVKGRVRACGMGTRSCLSPPPCKPAWPAHLCAERQRPAVGQHPLPPWGDAAGPPRLQRRHTTMGAAAAIADGVRLHCSCRRCCCSASSFRCSSCCRRCCPSCCAASARCSLPAAPRPSAAALEEQLGELRLSAKGHHCRRAAGAAGAADGAGGAARLRRQAGVEAGAPPASDGGQGRRQLACSATLGLGSQSARQQPARLFTSSQCPSPGPVGGSKLG